MDLEFIYMTEITIPLIQIVMLLIMSTLALLYGRMKIALLINYLFALYWGFFLNRDAILEMMAESESFVMIYFGLGIGVALLAVVGFIVHQR